MGRLFSETVLSVDSKRADDIHIFILVLFSAEFLFLIDNKTAGIPLLREGFTLYLFGLTLFYLLKRDRWGSTKYEVFIMLYVLYWFIASPVLSFFMFGQPIYYGFLEERRILSYLIFFPVFYWLLRSGDLEKLALYMVVSFVLASLVGVLYSKGVLLPRIDISYRVDGKDYSDFHEIYEGFRSGRFRMATNFLFITYVYSLIRYRASGGMLWLVLALYCVWYTWDVVQTRTLMATLFAATLIIFRNRIDRVFFLILLFGFLGFVSVIAFSDFYVEQYNRFLDLVRDYTEHSGPRTREITIGLILSELAANPIGYGALSLQWQEGFLRVYNDNFYLSDVGVFGVLYRFGIAGLALIAIYYYMYISRMIMLRSFPDSLVRASNYVVAFGLINFIFSNGMAFDGCLYGFILAVYGYVIVCHVRRSYG